jgi:hypothetical protein
MAQSPCSLRPLADSPWFNFPLPNPPSPLLYPSTYLAPSSCDRNVHLRPRLVINGPTLTHPFPNPPLPSKFREPQLPSALQRRPQEYSSSCCPEHLLLVHQENKTHKSNVVHSRCN